MRDQSSLLRRLHPHGIAPFDIARVRDLGDCWIEQPYTLEGALAEIAAFYATIIAAKGGAAVGRRRSFDQPADPARGLRRDGPVGMIHIDAHCDTGDDYLGSRFHHGAPFRRGDRGGAARSEAGDPDRHPGHHERSRHVGLSTRSGMRVLGMEEFHDKGWHYAAEEARRVAGGGPTYLTVRYRQPGPVAGAWHRDAGGGRYHRTGGAAGAPCAARHRLRRWRSGRGRAAVRCRSDHVVQRRFDTFRKRCLLGGGLAEAHGRLACHVSMTLERAAAGRGDFDQAITIPVTGGQASMARFAGRRARRLGPGGWSYRCGCT